MINIEEKSSAVGVILFLAAVFIAEFFEKCGVFPVCILTVSYLLRQFFGKLGAGNDDGRRLRWSLRERMEVFTKSIIFFAFCVAASDALQAAAPEPNAVIIGANGNPKFVYISRETGDTYYILHGQTASGEPMTISVAKSTLIYVSTSSSNLAELVKELLKEDKGKLETVTNYLAENFLLDEHLFNLLRNSSLIHEPNIFNQLPKGLRKSLLITGMAGRSTKELESAYDQIRSNIIQRWESETMSHDVYVESQKFQEETHQNALDGRSYTTTKKSYRGKVELEMKQRASRETLETIWPDVLDLLGPLITDALVTQREPLAERMLANMRSTFGKTFSVDASTIDTIRQLLLTSKLCVQSNLGAQQLLVPDLSFVLPFSNYRFINDGIIGGFEIAPTDEMVFVSSPGISQTASSGTRVVGLKGGGGNLQTFLRGEEALAGKFGLVAAILSSEVKEINGIKFITATPLLIHRSASIPGEDLWIFGNESIKAAVEDFLFYSLKADGAEIVGGMPGDKEGGTKVGMTPIEKNSSAIMDPKGRWTIDFVGEDEKESLIIEIDVTGNSPDGKYTLRKLGSSFMLRGPEGVFKLELETGDVLVGKELGANQKVRMTLVK